MINIRKLYNNRNIEVGVNIIPNITIPTNQTQKNIIIQQLKDVAYNLLYPDEGLNIYIHEETDTPWITVLRSNADTLTIENLDIEIHFR